jgi:hypothetical protein
MRALYAAPLIALLLASCQSPGRLIHPIVSRDVHETAARLRGAPIIVVAEIVEMHPILGPRDLPIKPSAATPGGYFMPIPVVLAEIRARVPLMLRGSAPSNITFHSWVLAHGGVGGYRSFNASPSTTHILFLEQKGPYLHTVGDFPAHDLEMRTSYLPLFIKHWQQNRPQTLTDLQRLAAAWIETSLETLSSPGPPHYSYEYMELVKLTGFDFIQSQLAIHCRNFPIAIGQASACSAWKWGAGPR